MTDMSDKVLGLLEREQRFGGGNKEAIDSLKAQLNSLQLIAKSLDERNGRVAAANQGPRHQPPVQNACAPVGRPVPLATAAAAARP